MNVVGLSYTTSPISEYLGSQIYGLLGFCVHDTRLGIANEKVVVACKDFLNDNEIILDYNAIKNDYDEIVEEELEKSFLSTKEHQGIDLKEIQVVMENNDYFKKVSSLKEKFWDMFIIDAFINNNDRNENNWGVILDRNTMKLRLSPIYDNGASFYNKSSDDRINEILNDDFKMKQSIYDSCMSVFNLDGKIINPLKYIESMKNDDCNKALLRIFPKINMEEIKELFDSIPYEYNNLPIFTKEMRTFYYKSLIYKYENVFKNVYDKILKEKDTDF